MSEVTSPATCNICGQIAEIWTPDRGPEYAQMMTDHGAYCATSGEIYRDSAGDGVWWISVYDVCSEYGGPEEGGWWFTTRKRVASRQVPSLDKAFEWIERFEDGNPRVFPTLTQEPEGYFSVRIIRGNCGPDHDDDNSYYE